MSDRPSAALLCACLLSACAGPSAELQPAWPGGPVYDASEEWAPESAQRSAPRLTESQSLRPSVRSRTPRAWPRWNDADYGEAPSFNSVQLARIARVQPLVHGASAAHGVPADLVNGIIWVESAFQTRARSPSGACGLMQLMPSTGREVARELGRPLAIWDPEFNIHAGTYYFAQLLRRFDGDLRLALAAYNAGPATVESWLQGFGAEPSRDYVERVLRAARAFRARMAMDSTPLTVSLL